MHSSSADASVGLRSGEPGRRSAHGGAAETLTDSVVGRDQDRGRFHVYAAGDGDEAEGVGEGGGRPGTEIGAEIGAGTDRQSRHHQPSHAAQHSLGNISNFSDETYYQGDGGEDGRLDKYPDVFESLEKTRSLASITALTPNRARFDGAHPAGSGRDRASCADIGGGDQCGGRDGHGGDEHDPYSPARPRLPFRPRLAHFTWAWYTLTMSTGGLSLLLAAQPHRFRGLREIGLAVYVVNIVLFACVTGALLARFFLFRGTLTRSITHRREGFFFPTFFLSIATLITSTQRYAVGDEREGASPGLLWAVQVSFWIYLVATTVVAVGQYSFVFSAHRFGLHTMMPTWILPIFPVMLSGTIASVIAGTQPKQQALSIITAGLTCQGLGLSVAVMMYAHMVGRLMQSGLPDREHRPGLFMCVGPPAFTALAFLGLAGSLPPDLDVDMDGFLDASGIRTTAIVGAGYLWALSFWWFGIAALAVARRPPRYFHLGWWATVFPNIGFVLATVSLGREFQNAAVLWFSTVVSVLLVLVYLFVLVSHVRAVVVQDIMYPGRDEDVEDH